MSSGACRALVTTLLTLVVAVGMAVPVVAQSENLRTEARTEYKVNPNNGRIEVTITLTLRNNGEAPIRNARFSPLFLEDSAIPRFSSGADRIEGSSVDLPGPWRSIDVSLPNIPANGRRNVSVTYTLNDGGARNDRFPVRADGGYVFTCLTGQDTDRGTLIVDIGNAFRTTTSGSEMEESARGLTSGRQTDPVSLFTCIEGTNPRNLAERSFLGPANRDITLQAYPDDASWLTSAQINVEPALDAIQVFLGQDIPGLEPVLIRETPPASLGGFASDHSTPGIVQVDESAGVQNDILHEAAHAWFSTDNYPERWMREGMAEWTSSSMNANVCSPVGPNSPTLDLSDWQIVRPTAPADIDAIIEAQAAAACGIVSAVAAQMDEATFKAVVGTLLTAEAKYVGNGAVGSAPTDIVDFREWLDAVDERGLVPSGVEDLDFAQDLIASYGIANDSLLLEERSLTRARYHDFLSRSDPMAAPVIVRQAMDDWRFRDANRHLDQVDEILAALTAADELVPAAGLLTIIQDAFESADSASDLDVVLERATTLLTDAEQIVTPLAELAGASPTGWVPPMAVQSAITDRRFEDVIKAIIPSLRIVQDATAADVALPAANLLEGFRVRYESSPTTIALEELADEIGDTRRQAEATSIELATLRRQVGDWQIPAAVTDPVAAGQIALALAISRDARGVISAAREAEQSLPEASVAETFQPRFEAVTSGSEMATLRIEAEAARDQAVAVGDALQSLRRTVNDWTLPVIVTDPIDQRDFELAAKTAAAAQLWVENAAKADAALPEIEALSSIREQFQTATTLDQLVAGAQLADDWAAAASRVAVAIEAANAPRDLMTQIGLFGSDLDPQVAAALAAAKAGEVEEATRQAVGVIDAVNNGSSSGGLRLIGLIFLGVAIMGVLGLLVIFRRDSGPPWAKNTKPPWAQ